MIPTGDPITAIQEEWRPVVGYEGRYEVSNAGRVRSLPGGRRRAIILKQQLIRHGYKRVHLCIGPAAPYHRVHNLVAAAFLGPRPDNMEVDHRDFNPANNVLSNLEYVTKGENKRRSYKAGRSIPPFLLRPECTPRGERASNSKLTEADVRTIRSLASQRSLRELAVQYRVTKQAISLIINRKNWKHL